MKAKFLTTILLCLSVCMGMDAKQQLKPRLVVLTDIGPTDIEPDDMESSIRLLSFADKFEVEAIITGSGWNTGNYDPEWQKILLSVVDAYEKDLPNLMKRSRQKGFKSLSQESKKQVDGYWPSAEYIRSRVMYGSKGMGVSKIGTENDSEGSEFLIRLAQEKDDRPIWIAVWGGANTLAQALWKVKMSGNQKLLDLMLSKFRVYTITNQDVSWDKQKQHDLSSHPWMMKEFGRKLKFMWDESAWLRQNSNGVDDWQSYAQHIQGHGNMGRIYPKYKWGVEGDTPSFLYVMPNGLNDPEHPEYVGWGGYFVWDVSADGKNYCYTNVSKPVNDISNNYVNSFYRAEFNDFAARMDWADKGMGNTNPVVVVSAPKQMAEGQYELNASKTSDAEGNGLNYKWWIVPEAGTYKAPVAITNSDKAVARLTLSEPLNGKTLHVICEVTDDGTPNLTSYRRVIIK